jgi:diguanylate cyclase (GGDEF)-like protein
VLRIPWRIPALPGSVAARGTPIASMGGARRHDIQEAAAGQALRGTNDPERTIAGAPDTVSKTRILIAEDETNLREVLRIQLEFADFEVTEARDGQEAVNLALASMPDLILSDVMMPHLDGFEVCRQLRANFATRHIPIILLTAKSEITDKIHGLEGGANDYITKPWEHGELMLRVRNVLEWSRQQRAASPLTGLPGNISINAEIKRRIALDKPFAMLQIDIDFFKAYNDHYGYARGDQAIQTLARILVDSAQHHGGDNFVGHIGGDDFVILGTPESAEALGQEIIDTFNSTIGSLYDAEDRERGYVEVPNRRKVVERFPLMSVTLALVNTERTPVSHLAQLVDIAMELKAHGKGIPGSVLVGERRRPLDALPLEDDRNVA